VNNKLLYIFILVFFSFTAWCQGTDEQLALHYYNEGDCERAISYFEKVYDNRPTEEVFTKYKECLKKQGDQKAVIKLIEKQRGYYPRAFVYQVMLGEEYEQQGNAKKAEKIYEDIIDNLKGNSRDIIDVQKAFSKYGKYDYALKSLEKGRKVLKSNYPLNIQFAEVYGELGRTEEMIDEYLGLLEYSTGMITSLQRVMPRMIDFEDENSKDFELLKNNLIKRIQKNPNETIYAEMLIWSFIQRKNFGAALIQSKGLDKRTSKDGREVYNIGKTAVANKDYETGRKAFKYVVDLGESLPYYYAAEQALLNTRFKELTIYRNYNAEQLEATIQEYETALNRIGNNAKSIPILLELAHIQAFYGNNANEAKTLLENAMEYRGLTDIQKAEVKMLLADILVLLDDIWEASLLYMQIDKAFKYETIGQEAKFKNARIFYFDGDFKWAQSLLDVLKASTSKLIANDAMKLSIFITDNLGLDSNYRAMNKFANADLLLMQHRYEEAFHLLDSMMTVFPYHRLGDDVLMRKAQAMKQQGKWEKAIEYYQEVVERFGEDINADEALFNLAYIHEEYLFDFDKAKELYFELMKKYKGSLFVTEARKRYRNLQDNV
jgi:tetratricopeptide (TPR) repeat protein